MRYMVYWCCAVQYRVFFRSEAKPSANPFFTLPEFDPYLIFPGPLVLNATPVGSCHWHLGGDLLLYESACYGSGEGNFRTEGDMHCALCIF